MEREERERGGGQQNAKQMGELHESGPRLDGQREKTKRWRCDDQRLFFVSFGGDKGSGELCVGGVGRLGDRCVADENAEGRGGEGRGRWRPCDGLCHSDSGSAAQ